MSELKIKDFFLCFLGWNTFLWATASFASAIHRYLTGGFLGTAVEVSLCFVFALFYTIWWFLVVKR